jgi:hypothetical protein
MNINYKIEPYKKRYEDMIEIFLKGDKNIIIHQFFGTRILLPLGGRGIVLPFSFFS